MKNKNWYSAKGLFKHKYLDAAKQPKFEEQIILLRANSIDMCEKKALKIFKKNEAPQDGIFFLRLMDVYKLFDIPADGSEIYSFMRLSQLSTKKYIDEYEHDGKPDSCDKIGWNHVWYNIDGNRSGCYNCNKTSKKKLWNEK